MNHDQVDQNFSIETHHKKQSISQASTFTEITTLNKTTRKSISNIFKNHNTNSCTTEIWTTKRL